MYVIKEPKEIEFNRIGHKGKSFPTADLTNKTEYLIIQTEKELETTLIEHDSDFTYYIVEGSGEFIIDGKKEKGFKGDLVINPAGKSFTYKGKLKLLLIACPPWKEAQEEML